MREQQASVAEYEQFYGGDANLSRGMLDNTFHSEGALIDSLLGLCIALYALLALVCASCVAAAACRVSVRCAHFMLFITCLRAQ